MKIYDGRSAFYQWDVDQKVTSETLTDGDEVHFYNVSLPHALVAKAYTMEDGTIVADVPNILLQKPLVITAYMYETNADASRTRLETLFDVIKRAKPSDYVYTETELYTIDAKIKKALRDAKKSGKFDGKDGLTPHIGENGNWWIGEEDTGVKAQGSGENGITPHIGGNGNWWLGDTDTGVKAKGEDGKDYIITEDDKAEIKAYIDGQIEPLREDINGAIEMLTLMNEGGLE